MTMARITARGCGAITALLVTLSAGLAHAQAPPPGTRRTGYCKAGLLTLVAGQAKFHVSLDDWAGQPSTLVSMRLLDQHGNVLTSRSGWLRPGASLTLEYTGIGQVRPFAETFESLAIDTGRSDRRGVVGTLELFDDFRAVLPVLCAEPAGQGRIPG
jgi:hypothetical protein